MTEIRQYAYNGYLSNVGVHKIYHLKFKLTNHQYTNNGSGTILLLIVKHNFPLDVRTKATITYT